MQKKTYYVFSVFPGASTTAKKQNDSIVSIICSCVLVNIILVLAYEYDNKERNNFVFFSTENETSKQSTRLASSIFFSSTD